MFFLTSLREENLNTLNTVFEKADKFNPTNESNKLVNNTYFVE